MRIGELARRLGVSTDTIRFYERSGWLPRPARAANAYRDYREQDLEHLRLLIDLRRLDLPLEDAARIATWCHTGHCADSTGALPPLVAERRAQVLGRIADLQRLADQLGQLERHLSGRRLDVLGPATACCDAAGEVLAADRACACCGTAATVPARAAGASFRRPTHPASGGTP